FTVISGGEPFLWRDGNYGIMDMFERHHQDYHLMFTNSILLTEDVARRMAELANITPSISVEGFEKETDARRGKGTYRRILKAMEHLRKHGVPFGISVTPTKHNWDLLTSDEFFEYFFLQEGALYGWMFQYMPIGRGPSLELMVSPEERLEMLKRMQRLVWERKFLLVDFWNSGTATGGCISAGRREGYFYIDWNGNVTPCVFVPYAAANIYKIYEQGGDLNTIMNTPFFKRIREWQRQYGYEQPPEKLDNWLCPCVVRDHFEFLQECAAKYDLTPINEQAAEAIKDPEYCQGMIKYGQEYKKLTDPMWQDIFRGEGGMVYEQPKSLKKSQAA
ncbi:MAG: radical SAM protein, partial [Pseudomonadota bacterium]